MNKTSIILSAIIFICTTSVFASKQHLTSPNSQQQLSEKQALAILKQGNQRYAKGDTVQYNQKKTHLKRPQSLAFIFSCIDSSSPPEVVFDQPAGAMFVSRIAGDVIGPDVLGSMEFVINNTRSKLIVIMGHTQCRTVASACAGVTEPKNFSELLIHIKPAVEKYSQLHKGKVNCKQMSDINGIAKQNIINQMHDLMRNDKTLANKINNKKITLVGAMHDMTSGKVTFFDINGNPV